MPCTQLFFLPEKVPGLDEIKAGPLLQSFRGTIDRSKQITFEIKVHFVFSGYGNQYRKYGLLSLRLLLSLEGRGVERVSQNATVSSHILFAFFLMKHSLGFCKSLAISQSSNKADSENFCQFFLCFCGRIGLWSSLSHNFYLEINKW